jgi:molybdopterin synthase catalytic subunit
LGVGEKGIAAVDDDVALFHEWRDLADHLIDRLSGLDHHLRFARFLERANEFFDRASRPNVFSLGACSREFVGNFGCAIKNGDRESFGFHVENEVLSHNGQADESNIALIRAHFSVSFLSKPQELQSKGRLKDMANSVCEILLTESALQAPGQNGDSSAGAIIDFLGVVRKLETGREIAGIDYEAHIKMAEHQLRLIANAAIGKFELQRVVLHHRIGFVPAGEASLFLRVSASHRAAAFNASKWIVDELKKKVPIWKKPKYKTASHIRESETVTAI